MTAIDDLTLPTLLPTDRLLPKRCPHCGSGLLDLQPPMGADRRGMLSCVTCSRTLCWLRPALRLAAPTGKPGPKPAPATICTHAPFRRHPHCDAACRHGQHDPHAHEMVGWGLALDLATRVASPMRVETGPLVIDYVLYEAAVDGRIAKLDPTEWRVLSYLGRRSDQVCRQQEIVAAVWGAAEVEMAQDTTWRHLRKAIAYLRNKLGPAGALIETSRGHGYRLRLVPTS